MLDLKINSFNDDRYGNVALHFWRRKVEGGAEMWYSLWWRYHDTDIALSYSHEDVLTIMMHCGNRMHTRRVGSWGVLPHRFLFGLLKSESEGHLTKIGNRMSDLLGAYDGRREKHYLKNYFLCHPNTFDPLASLLSRPLPLTYLIIIMLQSFNSLLVSPQHSNQAQRIATSINTIFPQPSI